MYRIVFFSHSLILYICCVIGVGCSSKGKPLPYYNTPDFSPHFILDKNQIKKEIPHQIADFSFTDQHEKQITHQNIEGKIHLANFIFTSCGSICPVMTNHLKDVQKEFYNHPRVVMLSFSVTPWIDNPQKLRQFAQNYQISASNWHLLTGSKAQIYDLARKSYFAEEDLGFSLDSTDFLHTEHIVLVDSDKRIRGIYNGTLGLEIRQLRQDIHALLEE